MGPVNRGVTGFGADVPLDALSRAVPFGERGYRPAQRSPARVVPVGRRCTSPRKQPRQDRARDTVDALLEATARTLIRVGYDRASTNRIALEAGVSVGSLYQYFPNKESLVAALIDRHCDEMATLCRDALGRCAELPLADAVRETVQAMVAAHRVDPQLHLVLQEQVPRVGRLRKLDELHAVAFALVKNHLSGRRAEVKPPDLDLAAYFVVETMDALLHSTLGREEETWSEPVLVTEITRLLVAYLTS